MGFNRKPFATPSIALLGAESSQGSVLNVFLRIYSMHAHITRGRDVFMRMGMSMGREGGDKGNYARLNHICPRAHIRNVCGISHTPESSDQTPSTSPFGPNDGRY